MLRKFPYLSRLASKLLYEILPAAVASAIGGIMFNHYARQPVAPAPTVIAAPANPELMRMVRDDHAFLIDYLKKSAEAHQQASLAAEQNAKRIKTAEIKTRTVTARVAERPEKRFVATPPVQHAETPVAEAPQLPQTAIAAAQAQPAERNDESPVMATLHDVTATVARIPSLVRSTADWFSDATPPRPPASLPEQNFLKASM